MTGGGKMVEQCEGHERIRFSFTKFSRSLWACQRAWDAGEKVAAKIKFVTSHTSIISLLGMF
jgi:hypothetical protein